MKRRDFLKVAPTVGAAGLIFDGCGKPEKLIPLLVSPDEFVPYQEGWIKSVCQTCAAGCGLNVRVMQGESIRTIDGQEKRVKAVMAKKIEGNPEHPLNMGGTCARGCTVNASGAGRAPSSTTMAAVTVFPSPSSTVSCTSPGPMPRTESTS